jgi:hypothetical protein
VHAANHGPLGRGLGEKRILLLVLVLCILAVGAAAAFAAWAVFVYEPVPPTPPVIPAAVIPTAIPTAVPTPATELPWHTPSWLNPTLRMESPAYGMQAFLWWRPERADRDLGLIRDAGFGWVKTDFPWREIEGAGKGIFDWSRTDRIVEQVESYGLDLVIRLDRQPYWTADGDNSPPERYSDFGDFVYALASRYRGRIRAYEIWNEPNLAREWGNRPPNPEEYTALLRVAYVNIKDADPEAIVISAGMAPTSRWDTVAMPDDEFIRQMYAAGARPYFDVLGAHGVGYKASPETDPAVVARDPALNNNDPTPDESRRRVYCFRRVEDLRRVMVENGDADKQIALLEFGWTSDPIHQDYAWFAVTEEQKGEYLARAYQYAKDHWSPWIGLMSLIYVCDPDWTEEREEYWWAITYPDYPETRVRPAYDMLKVMPK